MPLSPPSDATQPVMPLLRLGFRPFYLLAAAFAAISVPVWLAAYHGWMPTRHTDLYWHAHEMLFGFALAVVIGFLYTASRNWTGLWTPRGAQLAVIAGVWLLGRLAMLVAAPLPAAVLDLAFLPLATWPLYQVLRRSGNKRNMAFVVVLALLWLVNLLYHLTRLGWVAQTPLVAIQTAILLVVLIETLIGGRVIPAFTANAAGVRPRVNRSLDGVTVALTAGAALAWAAGLPLLVSAFIFIAAAIAHTVRLLAWKPAATRHIPLLWILHASYAWIPAGFVLLWLSLYGVVTTSAAFHAFAVGSIAGLILGMMTRTALGHTARPLVAGRIETVMYGLIMLAALARLLAALAQGWLHDATLVLAMLCWSAAFLLYVVVYGRYLTQARLDGKDG